MQAAFGFGSSATGTGTLPQTRFALVFSAIIFAALAIANRTDECHTVSCNTDYDEPADRLSSMAFLAFGAGLLPLWAHLAVPRPAALLDAALGSSLAFFSYDINPDVHSYGAVVFVMVRVGVVGTVIRRMPAVGIHVICVWTALAALFLYGYGCPYVIADACGAVRLPFVFTAAMSTATEYGVLAASHALLYALTYPSADDGSPVARVIGLAFVAQGAIEAATALIAAAFFGGGVGVVVMFTTWGGLVALMGRRLLQRPGPMLTPVALALALLSLVPPLLGLAALFLPRPALVLGPVGIEVAYCDRYCTNTSRGGD